MPWKTVVGVVADMRRQRLDEPAIPCMFQPGILSQMDIAVRAAPAILRCSASRFAPRYARSIPWCLLMAS